MVLPTIFDHISINSRSSEVDPIEMGVKVSSDQVPDDLLDLKPDLHIEKQKESKKYSCKL